eukprot:NODE_74_length_24438_cov_0.900283.p10 type:complete len:175 gc:universal NODE_74_length_24438_cov_0.900283:15089-15613(+)
MAKHKLLRLILSSDFAESFFEIINESPVNKRSKIEGCNSIIYSSSVRIIRKCVPLDFKVQSIKKSKLCLEKKNWIVMVDSCTYKMFERFNRYSKRYNIVVITSSVSVDPDVHEYILEDRSNMPSNKYIKKVYDKIAENEYGGDSDPFSYMAKQKSKKPSPLRKEIIPRNMNGSP